MLTHEANDCIPSTVRENNDDGPSNSLSRRSTRCCFVKLSTTRAACPPSSSAVQDPRSDRHRRWHRMRTPGMNCYPGRTSANESGACVLGCNQFSTGNRVCCMHLTSHISHLTPPLSRHVARVMYHVSQTKIIHATKTTPIGSFLPRTSRAGSASYLPTSPMSGWHLSCTQLASFGLPTFNCRGEHQSLHTSPALPPIAIVPVGSFHEHATAS